MSAIRGVRWRGPVYRLDMPLWPGSLGEWGNDHLLNSALGRLRKGKQDDIGHVARVL